MKLLIVDDHAVVRAGLRQIVLDHEPATHIIEAGTVQEAEELLRVHDIDMILLDLSLPDKNGIDLLKYSTKEFPRIPVLILSIYPADQYAIRAIKAGAKGYLTKESAPDELISAIDKVKRGGRYLTPAIADMLASTIEQGEPGQQHVTLSDREYQVLCLIGSGMSVSEVAEKMALSVKTVSTYRKRILTKMNMHNNAELTHYALKHGLVE